MVVPLPNPFRTQVHVRNVANAFWRPTGTTGTLVSGFRVKKWCKDKPNVSFRYIHDESWWYNVSFLCAFIIPDPEPSLTILSFLAFFYVAEFEFAHILNSWHLQRLKQAWIFLHSKCSKFTGQSQKLSFLQWKWFHLGSTRDFHSSKWNNPPETDDISVWLEVRMPVIHIYVFRCHQNLIQICGLQSSVVNLGNPRISDNMSRRRVGSTDAPKVLFAMRLLEGKIGHIYPPWNYRGFALEKIGKGPQKRGSSSNGPSIFFRDDLYVSFGVG